MKIVLTVVMFGGIGAVFLVVVPIGLRNMRKHRAAVEAFATKLGWRYTQRNDNWARISARYPFNQGTLRRAIDIIEGTYDERTVAAFELMCTSSGGGAHGTNTSEEFSICLTGLPVSLPYLEVSHLNALGRMAQSFGEHPVQIESEEFNRSYTVHSSDPKFASDVLSPKLVQALLAQPPLHWFIEGGLLVSSRKQHLQLDTLTSWFSTVSMIAASIPDFVLHDHGLQASQVARVAQVVPQPVAPAYPQQQPAALDYPQPSSAAGQPAYAGTHYAPQPPAQPDYAQQPTQPEYAQQPAFAWPNQNILPGK